MDGESFAAVTIVGQDRQQLVPRRQHGSRRSLHPDQRPRRGPLDRPLHQSPLRSAVYHDVKPMIDADKFTHHPIRDVIAKIDAAWRLKQFDGLDECFHRDAVIVGPGYTEFARGRDKCTESYREFARNAAVLAYSESSHALRIWNTTAVYTLRVGNAVPAPRRSETRSWNRPNGIRA